MTSELASAITMAMVTQYVVNDWSAWKGLLQLQHLLRKLPQPENWTYVRFGLTIINYDGMFPSMQCHFSKFQTQIVTQELTQCPRHLLRFPGQLEIFFCLKSSENILFSSLMNVLFRKDLDLASEASEAKAKRSKIQSSYKFVLVFIFRRRYLIMTR